MNQDELIERLKDIMEYEKFPFNDYKQDHYPKEYYTFDLEDGNKYLIDKEFVKYHTSFDWSVPVWSRAAKDYNEIHLKYKTSISIRNKHWEIAAKSIHYNDPLQFFINLSDLIREIKKYK